MKFNKSIVNDLKGELLEYSEHICFSICSSDRLKLVFGRNCINVFLYQKERGFIIDYHLYDMSITLENRIVEAICKVLTKRKLKKII